MVEVICVLALLVGLFGLMGLSQATLGVGTITFACLLAIFGRIAQASKHEFDARRRAERQNPTA